METVPGTASRSPNRMMPPRPVRIVVGCAAVSAPYNPGQRPHGYAPQHAHPAQPAYAAPPPAYAPAPPHGYGPPQQTYAPPQAYQAPPVPQTQCRFCGNVPAAEVTFRGHRGMGFIMQ